MVTERCAVLSRKLSFYVLIVTLGYGITATPKDIFATERQDTVGIDERRTAITDEFSLAVELYNRGEYSLAFDHFRAIIEAHPATTEGIESRYYLGMVYRRLGQDENARMALQTFALTFPDHKRAPEAWWNIAEIHAAQKRYNDAGLALERLFQFHHDHELIPAALLQANTYFEKAGDRHKAETYVRRIILDHSTSDVILEARLRFGNYRLRDGHYSQATSVFQRVIDDTPERSTDPEITNIRAAAVLGLARSYHRQRYYEQADREYARVMQNYENSPSYPLAVIGRAELYQERGQHLEAVDLFRGARHLSENSTSEDIQAVSRRALYGIAESYKRLGDYSSAATFFDLYARQYSATATKEELLSIWSGAARSNEGMGNYWRAVEWWDRIIASDAPSSLQEEAYIRSAVNYIEAGQYSQAVQRLRSYTEQFSTPNAAEALYRLGKLYEEKLNEPRRALAAYEELVYRFPNSRFVDNAFLAQARMQLAIGNDRMAQHLVEEFPRRFPGSSFIAEIRELAQALELYHLQDRDGGFQSITLLMSDMIAGAPRGELAFQLGEIYFNKLKQYPEAARQFEVALSLELPQERKNRAEYLYASSLYRTAVQDEGRRNEMLAKLQQLMEQSGRSPNHEVITYYYLQVLQMVAGPAEFINAAEKYIQNFPRSERAARIRLLLATTFEAIDEQTNAVLHYTTIIRNHQNTPEASEAAYRLAQYHIASNNVAEARTILSNYNQQYSSADRVADATLALAHLEFSAGNHGEAARLYSTFVQRYPYHEMVDDVRKNLALSYMEEGRYEDALAIFDEIIRQYEESHFNPRPVSESVIYQAATSAFRNRDVDRAIELYEEYLLRDRSSERAGIAATMLAELYTGRGQRQIAEYYRARASEIIRTGIPNRDLADVLYLNGQYVQAIPHLSALANSLESEELKKTYHARVITAFIRSGQVDNARREIERFRTEFPRERDALIDFEFEFAMLQFRNRSYDAAARSLTQFIQQHQRHDRVAYAHFYLGRTWEAVGRRSDARRKYEEVLEKFPNSPVIPDVHLAYAGLLLREEQFVEAIDHYRLVLEMASDDDGLMYYALQNLAQAYEEIGFFESALDLIAAFLSRYPHDESYINKQVKIGTLYQRAGLYERSVEKFQSLILYADRALETELRFYTGDSFHMMGNYHRAIREFRTVTLLDPRTTQLDWTATALYMAGQSFEQLGKPEEAIAQYQEIIDRRGIDAQYKAAARREIERVRTAMRQ